MSLFILWHYFVAYHIIAFFYLWNVLHVVRRRLYLLWRMNLKRIITYFTHDVFKLNILWWLNFLFNSHAKFIYYLPSQKDFIQGEYSRHVETNQLICSANELTGFYMIEILVLSRLTKTEKMIPVVLFHLNSYKVFWENIRSSPNFSRLF